MNSEQVIIVMNHYNYSVVNFAKEIGINPATMSNIKNNKANPTLDVVEKIVARFPEISIEWLITGQGQMLKTTEMGNRVNVNKTPSLFPELDIAKDETFELRKKNNETVDKRSYAIQNEQEKDLPLQVVKKDKTIEKVIIVYSDKTFEEYKLNKES